jgi:hypothetical protein
MTKHTSIKSRKVGRRGDSKTASKMICFSATLHRPAITASQRKDVSWGRTGGWTFLTLPQEASAKLPSRGQTTVAGTFNGLAFQATLEPDGQGGHWLKVDRKLRESLCRAGAGAELPGAGDVVTLEFAPVTPDQEPEPKLPADLRKALAADFPGGTKARQVWSDITPIARRDWIQWIVSAKQAETRARRIKNACSMLAAGKRRPCCFDRSGMYGKSLRCPVADDNPLPGKRM